ncbi:MAG TPA: hypothetical protein DEH78_22330 [Solibacterales bacterium]|nr:hypothetical protein [Bryobacterales bacterium]
MRDGEWVIAGYFVYAAVLAGLLPIRADIALTAQGLNGLLLMGLGLVAWLARRERWRLLRDLYAFPPMLLAYREMGWFAQPHADFLLEKQWVIWDRALLYGLRLKEAIELFGPALPSILEIAYSLVYTLSAFSVAILYACGRRERTGAFLFTFLLAIFACYALFPYFPSEPPRTVFPESDLPSHDTVFRQFNRALLGGYGIHTSVFPSAHVAGAFAAAFALRRLLPEVRWPGRLLLALAVLIATATVYGRYHYAVDAAAGFGAAVFAEALGRRRGRRLAV